MTEDLYFTLDAHEPDHAIARVLNGGLPFVLRDCFLAQNQDMVVVLPNEEVLNSLAPALRALCPAESLVILPAWDCLPYDHVSPHTTVMAQRAACLSYLATRKAGDVQCADAPAAGEAPLLLLTTVNAYLQRVPPVSAFEQGHKVLRRGDTCAQSDLLTYLGTHGYHRVPNVYQPGEFAHRGGIIDIFPGDRAQPVRLDFFGDEIESLHFVDVDTQRSEGTCEIVALGRMRELLLEETAIKRFRMHYREILQGPVLDDAFYAAASAGRYEPGLEQFLPLFYDNLCVLEDYLRTPSLVLAPEARAAMKQRCGEVADLYAGRRAAGARALLPPQELYLRPNLFAGVTVTELHRFDHEGALASAYRPLSYRPQEALGNLSRLDGFVRYGCEHRKSVILTFPTHVRREQARGYAADQGWSLLPPPGAHMSLEAHRAKKIYLYALPVLESVETDAHVIVDEDDIFGQNSAKRPRKKRRQDLIISELSTLKPGDYVVHENHGIGKFSGLVSMTAQGYQHDCLELVYQGGDKLFLPVENIELISRYGGEHQTVVCDKLGGASWQARKSKVKKDLLAIADRIMTLAAERQLKAGPVIAPPADLLQAFEAQFPFQETDDQLHAIDDVQADLTAGRPMDRLICGDVGFGKTEVAMRAAFAAVMSGFQAAVITPTTLLARQHTYNFQDRFSGFDVTIAQLSRFVPPKEQRRIRDALQRGDVGIVIGTHTLMSERVQFSNLGLVIVDEEQHFGVKQKEKLKGLTTDVHMLTLSATPIPRTLQLAMNGIRDLSLIATPPRDRLPVHTYITPVDPATIAEAIMREVNRGGQCYYVCPRISDIKDIEAILARAKLDVTVEVAHGKLAARELDRAMVRFADGGAQVLIATNIIESGIDLVRVNTLIVHRPDLFGLSQLYQLRGRVGRGKQRGYAYLTYPVTPSGEANFGEIAMRRLEIIQSLATLGSGFQLASHDLDIRGAGNLLGEAQSGHVKEIGLELYQQFLQDAIDTRRAPRRITSSAQGASAAEDISEEQPTGSLEEHWSPEISLGTSVQIPPGYIMDVSMRMSFYRRFGRVREEADLEDLKAEMVDRFGPLPEDVESFVRIIEVKIMAKQLHIHKLEVGPRGVVMRFYKNRAPKPEALLKFVASFSGLAKVRPDHSIFFRKTWTTPEARFEGTKNLLTAMAAL